MKNTWKKVVALALALVCALAFTACGSGEKEAKKTVDGYMKAICKLDMDSAEKYLDDPSAMPEELENFDIDVIMEAMPAEFEPYADDMRGLMEKLLKKTKDNMSYEIKGVEGADGEFTVTVALTIPDFDSMNFEDIIGDSFSGNEAVALFEEIAESGVINDSSSEEEIMSAIMPKLVEFMEDMIDDIEMETMTEEKDIVVTEVDGEWLIDTEKSDLEF